MQPELIPTWVSIRLGVPWDLMGVITSMIILGFYAVVAGWCLQYLYASIMGGVHGDPEYVKTYFQTFASDPIRPTLWAVGFILLTHAVVVRGVRNGIEKASKILMPLLFILLGRHRHCLLLFAGSDEGCAVPLPS